MIIENIMDAGVAVFLPIGQIFRDFGDFLVSDIRRFGLCGLFVTVLALRVDIADGVEAEMATFLPNGRLESIKADLVKLREATGA